VKRIGLWELAVLFAFPALSWAGRETKVVLQDLGAQGVKPHEAAALTTATCHALSKQPGQEVVCSDDLRALAQWNAMSASFAACKEPGCYSNVGKALDARFVVSGSVAQVGEEFVLLLSMFDVDRSASAGRAEVKAASLEKLYRQIPEAVGALFEAAKKAPKH
jgi:hypothetical protein